MLPERRNNSWLPSIFNDFFDNDWIMRSPAASSPAINVVEKDNCYEVEVAAPGLTKDDFKISLDDNNLIIAMEKQEEKKDEDKDGRYIHREFSYASFNQRLALPDSINKEKITAKVDNGILKIDLPKLTESEVRKSEKIINIE
ncbi:MULTISPECIES: Hsp20/alpha crystallin family protein [Bacteroides]|nr:MULTISPECIES: Hsp20/alpha crystallin family protein [Bacteroides]HJD91548.1 Hsp20/alpha crystallin family protein [Bacteroides coprosuis]